MSTITPGIPPRAPVSRTADQRNRPLRPASMATTIDPIRVLRRHWVEILASAFFGAVLGAVAFFAFQQFYPLYSGNVLFEIQQGLQKSKDLSTVDVSNDETVFRLAQTETYLLTSREVISAALRDPDIMVTEWHKQFVQTNSDGTTTFNALEAMDELMEEVSASPVRGTNLFMLRWSAHKAEDVPKVLNAIAGAYVKTREARDKSIYDKNYELFQSQLARTQRALDDMTQEVKRLIKTGKLTSLEDVNRSAEAVKHQQLIAQLAGANGRLMFAQSSYQLNAAKLEGKLEPTADDYLKAEREMAVEQAIQAVMATKTELRRLIENGRLSDDPMVRNLEARVRAIELERDAKIAQTIRRNLEAESRIYADEVEKMRASVEQLEDDIEKNMLLMQSIAAEQSEYEARKMEREHLEAQRAADLELINEVQLLRLRADASRVRMALKALDPREMSFPKKEIVIPLGVLVVMGLTVGIIFLRELMDQRVKSTADLAVIPGVHVLGGIPEMEEDPTKTSAAELVVRKHPLSVLAETYRQTVTNINTAIDRTGHQTILLVGGMPGAGTTTMATNFAVAFAATGKRVCVVDANFRRPRLMQAMELPDDPQNPTPGLGDLLSGSASLEETLVDAGGNITVIGAGTPANRVIDRLNNGLFESMVAELRGRFDLVLFDAPPAVVAGDALVLANKLDASILVVRAQTEHRGLVARLINQLSNARSELLGVVLNRPRGTAGGYLKKNYAAMAEYSTGKNS